jgi:hypothetical protein
MINSSKFSNGILLKSVPLNGTDDNRMTQSLGCAQNEGKFEAPTRGNFFKFLLQYAVLHRLVGAKRFSIYHCRIAIL